MEITVYGLGTCDSCRKAMAGLRAAGLAPRLQDVRAEPPGDAVIAAIVAAFGAAAVNRASATWRGLDAAAQALAPASLIAAHPAVMKRPVIAAGGRLFQGWGPETAAAVRAAVDGA